MDLGLDKGKKVKKKLGKKQQLLARLLVESTEPLSQSEICKQIGISNECYEKWTNDEFFNSAMMSMIDQYTDTQMCEIWKALLIKCKNGDLSAIKLFLELKSKNVRQSSVVIISGEESLPE